MMLTLDPAIFGCASPNPYSYTKAPSVTRTSVLQGRPRYTLKDVYANYQVDVALDLDDQAFAAWQSFWDAIGRGTDTFIMRLMLSSLERFYSGEEYPVHALGPWSAARNPAGRWIVQFRVELPGGITPVGTICDDIYGGPITALAADDIYGGPIDNLATDIIEPCEGVDPNAGNI